MSSSENSWDLKFTWSPDHHLTIPWPLEKGSFKKKSKNMMDISPNYDEKKI